MTENLRSALVEMMPQLRAFARSLTGGDRDFADDLVQDTLVKGMQAERQFEPGTNLRAWLFTILRNTFCSQVRRKRRQVGMADEDLEQLATTAAPQNGRLESMAFRRAFRQLSSAHREVLVLAVLQGQPYDTIAAVCGCEVGTVKSRVNRAREQLKATLLEGAPTAPGLLEGAPAARGAGRATTPDRRRMRAGARPGGRHHRRRPPPGRRQPANRGPATPSCSPGLR